MPLTSRRLVRTSFAPSFVSISRRSNTSSMDSMLSKLSGSCDERAHRNARPPKPSARERLEEKFVVEVEVEVEVVVEVEEAAFCCGSGPAAASSPFAERSDPPQHPKQLPASPTGPPKPSVRR